MSDQNLFKYCARPKLFLPEPEMICYLVNSILVPAQKFLEWHEKQFNFWSCTKYLDRPKTFWGLAEGQGNNINKQKSNSFLPRMLCN